MKPSALLRRLWRAQLRLRVMAGVVFVALVALAAFDVGAIATMRSYLIDQTDQDLRVALSLTRLQLPQLVPGYGQAELADGFRHASGGRAGGAGLRSAPRSESVPQSAVRPGKPPPPPRSILGEFDIDFVTTQGKQFTLEIGATWFGGKQLLLPAGIARVAIAPGPRTVAAQDGGNQLRVAGLQVVGGRLIAATSLDQVDKTMDRVAVIVLFGSVAVVLLIGLGVFLVLRRGLRPIEAMATQADRITAGDLTERVSPQSPRSEVGRLGAALNGMLARIEAGVHEREASQEQMRRFFADASHELRTPLASLRANAELYQQGALTSLDEVDEVMRRIALETRRMGTLVDDMLRLARLGQHPDQGRVPVDVTALVTACAERARIAAPARTWRVHIAAGLWTVGDEELLRRAVDNLLTNVLVHIPPHAAGTLSAASSDGTIAIEVRDDGPGVPPGRLPHIFERFYRAGTAPRPGSGLGLAIAAEIAAAHAGTASAALATPHGLIVTLTLPALDEDQDYPERSVAAVSA